MKVVCGVQIKASIPVGKIPSPVLDRRNVEQYKDNVSRMMAYTVIQKAGDDTKDFQEILLARDDITGVIVCSLPDVPGAVPGIYPLESTSLAEDKSREAAWIRQEEALIKARARGVKVSKLPSDEHGREMELKRERIDDGVNVDLFASDMYVEAARYVLNLCGVETGKLGFFLVV